MVKTSISGENPPVLDADLKAGIAASQSGDVDAALIAFHRALASTPANALTYFLIGSEYAGSGQTDLAETALMTAVVLSPKFQLARYQLGLLQFSSGRAGLALGSWEPLLDLDSNSHLASFVRGFAALATDDFAAARSHFSQGLSLNKDNLAVSEDIRRLLARFPDAHSSGTADGSARDVKPDAAAHVLVSNYGRFGTLH
jgi:tetratricopeptide (TPR) repeat protein